VKKTEIKTHIYKQNIAQTNVDDNNNNNNNNNNVTIKRKTMKYSRYNIAEFVSPQKTVAYQ
jgi:hypothetical protein